MSAKNNILVRTISKALHAFAIDADRPFALVFPVVRKFFVAHNIDVPTPDNDMPRVLWTYRGANNALMHVEASAGFFGAIGNEWFDV